MVENSSTDDYTYDVFISYSHADAAWVQNWLLSKIEKAGLHACIDCRDFKVGEFSLLNMRDAVDKSHRTLLVLTPDYVKSEWCQFEYLFAKTKDPAARLRRLVPVLRVECELPDLISSLTYLPMRDDNEAQANLPRLLISLGSEQDGAVEVAINVATIEENTKDTDEIKRTPDSRDGRSLDLGTIRRRLNKVFDDPRLDAFCLDYFPEVYDRFGRGLLKDEKITLLLDHCRRVPVRFKRLKMLLGKRNR